VAVSALSSPSPGVQVTVTLPAAGAINVTVFRSSSSGTVIVRGASHTTIAGSFTVADFEAPIGEVLSYTAVTFDLADVQSDESGPATITLASATAWLSDPLDPASATTIRIKALPEREYSLDFALMSPIGSDSPVQVSGVRQRGAFKLSLVTLSAAERTALRTLFLRAPVVLLRAPVAAWDLGSEFLGVGAVTERRVGLLAEQSRVTDLDCTYVQRPAPELAAPLHTYAEMTATGLTYRQIRDTGRTYLQLVQLGAT
jgi:hypothetical protein